MQTKIETVTVIGLGAMGHAFAHNLLKNNFTLQVWNRSAEKAEDLVAQGAKLGDSPQQAVTGSQVVILMLSDSQTTLDVVSQALDDFAANAIVVQMGTIGVAGTRELHQLFTEKRADIRFIDAPVSGTKKPAELAQVAILASGDLALASEIDPVFSAIGKGTHWLGEVGAGSAMKLVVNSWLIGLMQSLAESQVLADSLGFTPEQLWAVLDGGPLAAPYAKAKLETISQDEYPAQMQLKWAHKDAVLALQAGNEQQLPALKQITELWQQAIDAGYADQDLAVIAKYLAKK